MTLSNFITESNRIEGILGTSGNDFIAHETLFSKQSLKIEDIETFVWLICKKKIRNKTGMNVIVGKHHPLPGGPNVVKELEYIVKNINSSLYTPYKIHCEYEMLHSFMDGNGRSGRAIWAWMRLKENRDPFQLGFLHSFYYESLENYR